MKILLVDDDAGFRALVAPALATSGYLVVQAESLAEAAAQATRAPPDVLIVNGQLPDGEGLSLIAQLRAAGSKARVIFVTAHGMDLRSYDRLAKELDVSLVVHKPVVPTVLREHVDQLAAEVRPALAPPPPEPTAEEMLAQVRDEYRRGLPAKVAELTAAARQAREHPGDATALAEARNKAHRLRGTAGSYGYLAVGEACGRVETSLEGLEGAEDAQAAWAAVERALGDAGQAIGELEAGELVVRAATATGTTASVLLVDDDPDFVRFVEEVGRRQLFELVAATTAAEAMARAQASHPDAAIIDLHLAPPDRSFQLARALRGLPGCEHLPIAFISAAHDVRSRVAAVDAGASLYLAKPIDPDTLAAAVRQLVVMQQTSRPRVLIVGDDPEFCGRVAAPLRQEGMRVSTATDATSILEVLDETRPDLVLLDLVMQGVSGLDICRMLRATLQWQDLPIIFVTSSTTAETRVAAFRAGGDDFLVKPFVTEELLARVKVRVERARLLRERSEKDSLTGLLLRRSFLEALTSRMAESLRHGRPLTLTLLDLDHFKRTNDAHGHLAGDRVLAGLGKLLSGCFRTEDLRGRWGGEEFILAFPGEGADTIGGALTRLLAEFRETDFQGDDGEPFRVTFSAGVASFPADGASIEELLKVADRRLYQAKAAGRGRVVTRG